MAELHIATPASGKSAEILVLDEQEERLLGLEPSPTRSQKIQNWLDETYGPLPTLPTSPNVSWLTGLGSELAKNWRAGLTVSLVSVPLSLSLAIANGGTPVMGMTTAVWAGLMSALLGGSQFNIHGPTGALSGIVSSAAATHGAEVLPFIAILSGLLALVFFLLRLDKYCLFIPSAVMHGFTLGVAVIIAFGQLPFAFGLESPKHSEFYRNVLESLSNIASLNPWAASIFLVFTASLLVLLNRWPKIPWMMVAASVGVALGFAAVPSRGWLPSSLGLISLKDRYGSLEPRLFTITSIKASYFDRAVILAAIPVCFISVLETLISAKIADRLTGTSFQQPQEVLALGVANIVTGVFGGIPATAALARTALNVKSGATSRVAGIINAIGVALISLLLLRAFQFLLLPVIASILVVVAFRMIELEALHHMWVHDKKMFGLCVFVTVVVIFFGPTEGIIVGAIVALFMFAVHNARGHGEALVGKQGEATLSAVSLEAIDKNFVEKKPSVAKAFGDTIVYRIPGELTYLNAPSHIARVKKLGREYRNVILALRYVFYVDVDGLDALGDIVHDLEANDKRVLFSGVQAGSVRDMLEQAKWFVEKKAAGMVFPSYRDALAALDPATNAIADDDNDRAPRSLSRVAEPIEMEEFSRV